MIGFAGIRSRRSRPGMFYLRGVEGTVVAAYAVTNGTVGATVSGGYIRLAGRRTGVKEDRLGTVQTGSRFYPYGEESPATGQNTDKFGTYHRDGTTGFDYAINHMATLGRFLSPDPERASASVGRSGSWNRYPYVEGDPVNATDPSGRCPTDTPTKMYVCDDYDLRLKNGGFKNPVLDRLAEEGERQGYLDTEQHRQAMWQLLQNYRDIF